MVLTRRYWGVRLTTVQHNINFTNATRSPREECAIFSALLLLRRGGCFINRQAGRMCVVNIVFMYMCVG